MVNLVGILHLREIWYAICSESDYQIMKLVNNKSQNVVSNNNNDNNKPAEKKTKRKDLDFGAIDDRTKYWVLLALTCYNNNGYSEEDPKTCDNFLTFETLLTMHSHVHDKVMSDRNADRTGEQVFIYAVNLNKYEHCRTVIEMNNQRGWNIDFNRKIDLACYKACFKTLQVLLEAGIYNLNATGHYLDGVFLPKQNNDAEYGLIANTIGIEVQFLDVFNTPYAIYNKIIFRELGDFYHHFNVLMVVYSNSCNINCYLPSINDCNDIEDVSFHNINVTEISENNDIENSTLCNNKAITCQNQLDCQRQSNEKLYSHRSWFQILKCVLELNMFL